MSERSWTCPLCGAPSAEFTYTFALHLERDHDGGDLDDRRDTPR